jgi:hypothetical protein
VPRLMIDRTAVNNNTTGILVDGMHSAGLINSSVVTSNGTGISLTNSGQLLSYGNNAINNNLNTDGAPSGPVAPK